MLKIGTRSSPLAMWQAQKVDSLVKEFFSETILCPIKSGGDKNLQTPLYKMGVTGIFTKDLDIALLDKRIDIAVHSLKDMPTQPPKGILNVAVLARDFPMDIMVRSTRARDLPMDKLKIATSSLRRKAFWKSKFPETVLCDIRGNVQTRLEKLNNGLADATFFSQAGIARMSLLQDYEILDLELMIPAPGQGVIGISCREEDFENEQFRTALANINDPVTAACTGLERNFLHALEGGCTAPIGAFCNRINDMDDSFEFIGRLSNLEGTQIVECREILHSNLADLPSHAQKLADAILQNGGKEIMETLKNQL